MIMLVLAAVTYAAPLSAQGEDPTNLQVLPEDIGRQQLRGLMMGITEALGVECTFCHVEEVPGDRSTRDMASDDKAPKRTAREMLRMVQDINDRLAALPDRRSPEVRVTCATCHAGKSRPTTLAQEVSWAIEDGGIDAVRMRYQELREEYFGSNSYDFGPGSLNDAASELIRQDPETALAIVELNLEHYPEAASTWVIKGQIHSSLEQTDEAIAALERALEIQPNDRIARGLLRRLREGG